MVNQTDFCNEKKKGNYLPYSAICPTCNEGMHLWDSALDLLQCGAERVKTEYIKREQVQQIDQEIFWIDQQQIFKAGI